LARAYGQGLVAVSMIKQGRPRCSCVKKKMAGDLFQGIEHSLVLYAFLPELLHEALPLAFEQVLIFFGNIIEQER